VQLVRRTAKKITNKKFRRLFHAYCIDFSSTTLEAKKKKKKTSVNS